MTDKVITRRSGFWSWQWFYRLGSPKWFYELSQTYVPWLSMIVFTMLTVGIIWALGFVPLDAKQGNSFRIIYIHVPSAFLSMSGYLVMASFAAVSLIWKVKLASWMLKCAAPIGASMTVIALFSGSVWGKPTWGTYWVWDARTTFYLILLFIYLSIIALQSAYEQKDVADKICSILALVGTVNVPIIYWSVEWWYTLHQPATLKLTSESTIHSSMLYPLLLMIVTFYLMYALLLTLLVRNEILQRESKKEWVRDLLDKNGIK
ncbi:MAG: heme transporter permease [Gammaproteobacteria bacterium]|nr:heme transporter permease [Gammaproteobacteria bacterium]